MLSMLVVSMGTLNSAAVAQCRGGRSNDTDRDGVCNDVDNCPQHVNPDQADCDRDGLGDVCEVALCSPGDYWCADCNADDIPDGCGVPTRCDIVENGLLFRDDDSRGDQFGGNLIIQDDVMVVGAHLDSCGSTWYCGSVYVFKFDRLSKQGWIRQARLIASDPRPRAHFGSSLAISGDRLVVGARLHPCNDGINCGAAYVFRFNGLEWLFEARLMASDAKYADIFGSSVAISGSWIMVGAPSRVERGVSGAGAVYIFRRSGSAWTQTAKLTDAAAGMSERFGASVAIDGDLAVIGTPGERCDDGAACGEVFVYRLNGAAWELEDRLADPSPAGHAEFGKTLAVDDDTILVGSPYYPCADGSKCGAAHIFGLKRNRWRLEAALMSPNQEADPRFGWDLTLSGNQALIGSVGEVCESGIASCGSAYLFERRDSQWNLIQRLTASDSIQSDGLGAAVALKPGFAALGASFGDCPVWSSCGSVYLYDLSREDCNCNGLADVCDATRGLSAVDDFPSFPDCLTGPLESQPGREIRICCELTDVDRDHDVDLRDVATYMRRLTP